MAAMMVVCLVEESVGCWVAMKAENSVGLMAYPMADPMG